MSRTEINATLSGFKEDFGDYAYDLVISLALAKVFNDLQVNLKLEKII